MDSISTKTLEFFDNCIETQIIKTEDQNETDFTKALIELESFLCKKNIKVNWWKKNYSTIKKMYMSLKEKTNDDPKVTLSFKN